jgi:predicted RNase H-like nuclease (RuvC/YqgF family)
MAKELITADDHALEEQIEQSMRGIAEMRIENKRLKRLVTDYERDHDYHKAELENLERGLDDAHVELIERDKVIAQLRATCEVLERTLKREAEERAFYHAFSIEILAQLNVVGEIVAKSIAKSKLLAEDAEERAGHLDFAPGGTGGSKLNLPKVNLPTFMRNGGDE